MAESTQQPSQSLVSSELYLSDRINPGCKVIRGYMRGTVGIDGDNFKTVTSTAVRLNR